MSRNATILATFGGDERVFRLTWRELIDLQDLRDAGPAFILAKLFGGQWRVEDVREVIRLGLQGGGMPTIEATKLVKNYVEQHPEDFGGGDGHVMLAIKVLSAALDGVPDEPLGKKDEAPTQTEPSGSTISQMERSESGPSTRSAH